MQEHPEKPWKISIANKNFELRWFSCDFAVCKKTSSNISNIYIYTWNLFVLYFEP